MQLTRKAQTAATPQNPLTRAMSALAAKTVDRRAFLKGSGMTVGAAAFASQLPLNMIGEAQAQAAKGKVEVKRSVCTHCSVGCSIDAVVQDGVWIRQEPVFDSPLNLGAHCAKGASVREHGMTEHSHRLKYPMKLVDGKYKRISWEQAINEIGGKLLDIKKAHGADATMWIGSSKHNNEQSYLFRKFVSMFGTNNMDHQARICHSTTVAGVANTWGYGAMTNSYNDLQNTKCMFFIGSNAAEAHPVSMLHALVAKERGAKMIVADPRFTRTAAKADQYLRFRSGTDVALLFGMLHHIFKNGWEDQKYINDRVYGMDKVREDVMKKWTPDKVTEVTGVSEADVYKAAETMALNKPSTIIWCMGQTQHSIGNAFVRASCILQLALGNIGMAGGGANIYRGHDNVQGATDIGPNPDSLPGYYGIAAGAWKHWCRVWGVDYEWMKAQFQNQTMMEKSGMTVSRWIDGVLEKNELLDQDSNLRAIIYWGHAPNSQTRGLEMKEAMEKVDMMVIVDPYPTAAAAMPDRKDGVYLLPACTQFETSGSVTASNRSIQWREKIIDPLFESKTDHAIMYAFAKRFGFEKEFAKNYKLVKDKGGWDEPVMEDVTREFNKGTWTIGYTGQSPERLKAHMRLMQHFDPRTLRATESVVDKETGYDIKGDYFGLPWPCYGTPEVKHPGSPVLYRTDLSMMDGGGCFRANFGISREGVDLLAADGSHPKDSDITTGHPEFDHVLMKKLGWWSELTPDEQKEAEGKNWKTDLSGGIQRVCMVNHNTHFWGNAKARAVVWNFPDGIPQHREPLYSPRPDLVAKYPTHDDRKAFWRMPTLFKTVQQKAVADKVHEKYPIVLTSGRLVEYEGGGDETRSNPWLAELQQENFVEINTKDAENRGIKYWDNVWVSTPSGAKIKVRALVTERVGPGTSFIPFHFAGWWQGKDLLDKYPDGSAPIVRGEAVNTATTYGYDSVTMMQETKTTLCNIERA
ncbi:formate dehydrogenase subunit alpha [Usitatibacter palustris]|uniref:Periplasmic nitrate reductase n=1 Tax=Usitatibacter palustris TaxID=2732487 RepID=A0A6M4H8Q7_9PROT|nr:formate dehydrogenase subunit alpha [Usitatibacter palustris]QJR15575.1 Periplasmic nitrate reductase [Usitatibacter palustris]